MLSLVEDDPLVLEEKILKFCQCVFAISILFPFEKSVALHLNNTQGCLVDIGPVVLEKKISKFCQYFRNFVFFLPLEKGCGPLFEKT